MPTNNLPTITITFHQAAMEAVARSGSGILALCLKIDDGKATGETSETAATYTFHSAAEVDVSTVALNAVHKKMCKTAFYTDGSPKTLIVSIATDPATAFANIQTETFSWVCYGASTVAAEATAFRTAINTFNTDTTNARKIKAIMCDDALATETGDHFVGVERAALTFTDGTTTANTLFWRFLPRIAGIATATPITESFTYKIITDVSRAVNAATPADNIVYLASVDGYVRLSRAVNAAGTSIALVEARDIIVEDIILTWRNFYLGKKRNTRDNETAFCSQILGYLKDLQTEGVVNPDEDCVVEIDVAAMREAHPQYYAEHDNTWVMNHPYQDQVYIRAELRLVDVMTDLVMNIYLGD